MRLVKKPAALSTLIAVILVCVPAIEAQQPGKSVRIGYLDSGTPSGSTELLDAFRKQMTQLNWIEGKNVTIDYRYAESKGRTRQTELAEELVRLNSDVIVVSDTNTALSAKAATTIIPIIMAGVGDPVAQGLIPSLARPGGNITGLSSFADQLGGKRIEILKELLPKATRIGVLIGTPGGPGGELQLKFIKQAASALKLKLIEIGSVSENESLLNSFQMAVRERVDAIITTSGPVVFGQRKSIVLLAANYKLPGIYPLKQFVEEGGLMSYGTDRGDLYRRAAIYVDKILKGTKPSELPVERPTKFELFANLKAAKRIGLTIPPNVLARADKVIK